MRCPFCGSLEDRVVDSRQGKDGLSIRRRRECESCQGRFTTHERVEDLNLMVVKKGGERQHFNRDKIREGLLIACRKRSVSMEQIDQFVDEIERTILSRGEREIPSSAIGEEVIQRLQALDPVAYVRFASVYRDFRSVEEFKGALDSLLDDNGGGAKRNRKK